MTMILPTDNIAPWPVGYRTCAEISFSSPVPKQAFLGFHAKGGPK